MEPKGSVIITTTCQDPETFRFPAPSPGAWGCGASLPVYLVGHALSPGPLSLLSSEDFTVPHQQAPLRCLYLDLSCTLSVEELECGHGTQVLQLFLCFISSTHVDFPSQAWVFPGTKLFPYLPLQTCIFFGQQNQWPWSDVPKLARCAAPADTL